MAPNVEAWLRGPVAGLPGLLMPAAHALTHAREDGHAAMDNLTAEQLWARPLGVASVGFHIRHLGGALDRLLTYARGESLSPAQLEFLQSEQAPGDPPPDVHALAQELDVAVDRALDQLRHTSEHALLEPRAVGRRRLPSTVVGLLVHAAEHAARHAGQAITTRAIVMAHAAKRA